MSTADAVGAKAPEDQVAAYVATAAVATAVAGAPEAPPAQSSAAPPPQAAHDPYAHVSKDLILSERPASLARGFFGVSPIYIQGDPIAWIEHIRGCRVLPELQMRELCDRCCEVLLEESNVQPVPSPVVICGDIHGQFFDLVELFNTSGELPEVSYVFMGDYVDRGYFSLETISLMMAYKVAYPDRIVLLRGNHETRQITQVYGYYDECYTKYNSHKPWQWCTRVFDHLTMSALVDGHVFCVHGGLSPKLRTLDQIRVLERVMEIPSEGAFCDLVWSDPEDLPTGKWHISPRGAGYLFGRLVAKEFNQINGLSIISRAHQLVEEGYKYHFGSPHKSTDPPQLVTVWSAPNYCYRCGNIAAVLQVQTAGQLSFTTFSAVPDSKRIIPPRQPMSSFV